MKKSLLVLLPALALLCSPLPAAGAAPTAAETQNSAGATPQLRADHAPVVQMRHWQASTKEEKQAFLAGMVTMLELEKEWQRRDGRKPLPFDKSLNSAWMHGLNGQTLDSLINVLDAHAKAKPQDMNRPVVEVLWYLYAQPAKDAAKKGK
ncbi:hypothetical protein [Desulfovibrio cuneatus]|uniref:hypothetical protein n=1 Tax=Desulfovibrio cuneatus TaxID=159728 RepID=UPI00040AD328|nr:hypothetical protein [Desulfovibrio cuneatus]